MDVEESSSDEEVEQNQARKRRRGDPKKIIYEKGNLPHELEPKNAVCDTTEEDDQEEETIEEQQQPANLIGQLTGLSEISLFTGK